MLLVYCGLSAQNSFLVWNLRLLVDWAPYVACWLGAQNFLGVGCLGSPVSGCLDAKICSMLVAFLVGC